jgi:chromosome segregation ATPase
MTKKKMLEGKTFTKDVVKPQGEPMSGKDFLREENNTLRQTIETLKSFISKNNTQVDELIADNERLNKKAISLIARYDKVYLDNEALNARNDALIAENKRDNERISNLAEHIEKITQLNEDYKSKFDKLRNITPTFKMIGNKIEITFD